jgi:lipoprotein-releasing system permease protein
MDSPYELLIGWRYTRAGRATRRNGFISFISAASVIGIALGVWALIVVLSVMNGFQKEVRDRMLSVVSHVEIYDAFGQALTDPSVLIENVRKHPEVVAAAPFVSGQSLLVRGDTMRGVMVRGIDPGMEHSVTSMAAVNDAALRQLVPGSFGVVLGKQLAVAMGVQQGDTVTLVAPNGQVTPAGVAPRFKQVMVVGTFDSGHFEYDSTLVMMNVEDAAKIYRVEGPTGVRLRIRDLNRAMDVAEELQRSIPGNYHFVDWGQQNRTWFAAVKVEKRMMSIILTLIILVAAFNLLVTLVMSVQDKRADIAILRTLGASPRSIMRIFVVQGAVVGVVGTLAGLLIGLLTAFNIDPIVGFIERLFNARLLPPDIYLISRMPSDPQAANIVPVVLVSLLLAFLSTLYPSWRASRVNPAEALRYE